MLCVVKGPRNQILQIQDSGDKRCAICGDVARCVNYGGLSYSCESCKSFFRRSHTNNAFRNYNCIQDSNCNIDMETRKNCSYCRYQRCIRNGMDSKWLRSDKARAVSLAKKRSKTTTTSNSVPTINVVSAVSELLKLNPAKTKLTLDDKSKFFTMIEIFDMDNLYTKYAHSFHNIPYSEETLLLEDTTMKAAAITTETLQRVFFFCYLIPQFRELDLYDQVILLSKGASDLGLLNAALGYDVDYNCWPRRGSRFYQNCNLTKDELEKVIGSESCQREIGFMVSLQSLRPDEHVLMLLFLLILFNSGREGLRNVILIAKHQMHFARLFRNYLEWRYGATNGEILFREFISRLTELRKISGVINGISNFCELHPELNRMKCCKAFFALTFSSGNVAMDAPIEGSKTV